jgi:hypothetical protein
MKDVLDDRDPSGRVDEFCEDVRVLSPRGSNIVNNVRDLSREVEKVFIDIRDPSGGVTNMIDILRIPSREDAILLADVRDPSRREEEVFVDDALLTRREQKVVTEVSTNLRERHFEGGGGGGAVSSCTQDERSKKRNSRASSFDPWPADAAWQ